MPPFACLCLAVPLLAALPALAEVPAVVTDIAPIHSLVAKVMNGLGDPLTLVDQGADPHSYQLRPSQARALAGADLVIRIGPELTPWLDRTLAGAAAARVVTLLAAEGTIRRPFADTYGGDAAHDHAGTDPHAWLDPRNAKVWTVLIRDALIATDPANETTYRANADRALAELDQIDRDAAAILASAAGQPIIMGHDAYGYFADHFGLTIAGTVTAGDAAGAGAAHLSSLRTLLAGGKVRCLFPEVGDDPNQAAALLEGTATRLGPALDPEGVMTKRGQDLYGALIRELAQSIADCVKQAGQDISPP